MRLFLVTFLALSACAGTSGAWPSLARRPIETAAVVAAAPAVPLAAATDGVGAADISARLATIERDLNGLDGRLVEQQRLSARATAAAAGTRPDSEAWGRAQLETGRMEKLGGQLDDVRGRLDSIAGELAIAAATGSDVASALRTTGTLLSRTIKLAGRSKAAAAR